LLFEGSGDIGIPKKERDKPSNTVVQFCPSSVVLRILSGEDSMAIRKVPGLESSKIIFFISEAPGTFIPVCWKVSPRSVLL